MLSKITAASAASMTFTKANKCPLGLGGDEPSVKANLSKNMAPRVKQSSAEYPSDIFTCTATGTGYGVATSDASVDMDTYKAIVADVVTIYDALDDTVEDNNNPRAKFAGCLVRTAGHDFMDFRVAADGTTSGGSDGCMYFADGDNTGLADCLEASGLAATYENYCATVSLADYLVIIAEAVMGRTSTRYDAADYYSQGSAAKVFLENFKFGRTSADTCSWATGLMPNPEDGCDGLESIFVDNIYKGSGREWEFTAAISGAHTLGSASIANSGYDGFWGSSENAGIFNNDYYKGILFKGWGVELAVNGNADKNQWKRIDLGADNTHKEMMLNTDMCLAMQGNEALMEAEGRRERDAARALGEPLLAHEHNCCAWFEVDNLPLRQGDEYCGSTLARRSRDDSPAPSVRKPKVKQQGPGGDSDSDGDDDGEGPGGGGGGDRPGMRGDGNRDVCCEEEDDDSFGDCDDLMTGQGPAFDDVVRFAGDENEFVRSYVSSWNMATENGFGESDLWAIGSGTGLEMFDEQVDTETRQEACQADLNVCWTGPVNLLWDCLKNYMSAWMYCNSGGAIGKEWDY